MNDAGTVEDHMFLDALDVVRYLDGHGVALRTDGENLTLPRGVVAAMPEEIKAVMLARKPTLLAVARERAGLVERGDWRADPERAPAIHGLMGEIQDRFMWLQAALGDGRAEGALDVDPEVALAVLEWITERGVEELGRVCRLVSGPGEEGAVEAAVWLAAYWGGVDRLEEMGYDTFCFRATGRLLETEIRRMGRKAA